jgi:alpha-amylase
LLDRPRRLAFPLQCIFFLLAKTATSAHIRIGTAPADIDMMQTSQRKEVSHIYFDGKPGQTKQRNSVQKYWLSSRAVQLATLAVAIAAVLIFTLPLGACLTDNGRCGRTTSKVTMNLLKRNTPIVNDAASQKPATYSRPRVQPLTNNANPLLFQGFEWYFPKDGRQWSRLASMLPQLQRMGVGALWIPPPTKAATAGSVGYDVYDLWDLGEFNTNNRTATASGSKSDLLSLAQKAHEWGVELVIDAVLNQRSGADYVESCAITRLNPSDRLQPINPTKVTDVWVGFNFTARGKTYSNKTWSCNDFTAVDYDAIAKSSGVFKINGEQNDFAIDVSSENGNYDYLTLIDVAYDNVAVREDVKLWGTWITGVLGAAGFRIDAAKHISRSFITEWVTNTREAIADAFEILFVAEYWTSNVAELVQYVQETNKTLRVFDVPLVSQFVAVADGSAPLQSLLENSVALMQPDSAVTIVGNHDTQLGQSSDSLYVPDAFRVSAYAFTLLRQEAIPCIFYGDIFGVCNESGQCAKASAADSIANLAIARTFFAYGEQQNFNSSDGTSLGWVRKGDDDHSDGVAVMLSKQGSDALLKMVVGSEHASEIWIDILGNATTTIKIGPDGSGSFSTSGRGASVFVKRDSWNKLSIPTWNFDIYG